MTEQEAIKYLEQHAYIDDAIKDMCIKALKKQIPKKPIRYQGTSRVDCSICGNTVSGISGSFGDWCSRCGNRIDWSEEND